MVMYLGHVVEMGTTDQVFAPPYHPYTEALLSAVPIADTSIQKEHIVLEGHPIGDEPTLWMPLPNALSLEGQSGQWPVRTRGSANSHHGKRTPVKMPLGSIGTGRNDTRYQIGRRIRILLDIDQRHPHFAGVVIWICNVTLFKNARAALLRGYLCQSGVKNA